MMAEPTLVNTYTSNWADASSASESTTGVAWSAGDVIVVVQHAESGGNSGGFFHVLNPPTNANLTFDQLALEVNDGDGNDCYVGAFAARAASTQTGQTITATHGGTTAARGMRVFVYSGSDGIGATNTIDNSTAKTISLTREGANSHAVAVLADWNAVNDTDVAATPTGTVRNNNFVSGRNTAFCCSWGDQGAAGTTSYGITNHTGTVDMSGIVVEILGTEGGGRTTRNPRPYPLGINLGTHRGVCRS